MKMYRIVSLILIAAFFTACGYKSDLYLPVDKQKNAVAAKQPGDQQRKKDDASGEQEQN